MRHCSVCGRPLTPPTQQVEFWPDPNPVAVFCGDRACSTLWWNLHVKRRR